MGPEDQDECTLKPLISQQDGVMSTDTATSRKPTENRWYNQMAWLMISGGKLRRQRRGPIGRTAPNAVNWTTPRRNLLPTAPG